MCRDLQTAGYSGETSTGRSAAIFNSGPGAKRGTRFAAITIEHPLRGFLTCRAFRWLMPKAPKPEIVTRSPRARLDWIPSRRASKARAACARVKRASIAILPTRSRLFTRLTRCPRVLSKAPKGVNRQRKKLSGLKHTICYTALTGNAMDQTTVRLIAGILAVLLVAIIFLRRKKKKGAADDEF